MRTDGKNSKTQADEKFRKLCEISTFLNTSLTPPQVYLCQKLIKKGISPEALAKSIITVRKEVKKIQPDSRH